MRRLCFIAIILCSHSCAPAVYTQRPGAWVDYVHYFIPASDTSDIPSSYLRREEYEELKRKAKKMQREKEKERSKNDKL